MTENILAYIVNSPLAPKRAKHYITFSKCEGSKVHVVPGDIIPEAIEKAEASMHCGLRLRRVVKA